MDETSQANSNAALAAATLAEFENELEGTLIRPGDEAYDDARRVWNGMIDRHPALIVQCTDVDDVVASVQFASSHNLPLAVRGGGHNVAGFATCDDGIVIDLSPMKNIEVDGQAQMARAQGGLVWGEFDAATQAEGLATTGGLVSTTGIAGFTLGGGIGWLMRKYGLALDNLTSVKMVLADGRRVTASGQENADLFWGVRGGGGNFGVVTEFTYQLHPVGPSVFGGALFHPASKAKDLLHFYREWVSGLPDELTSMFIFLTAPPAPFVPPPLVGTPMVAVALCCAGPLDQAVELVKPLRELASPAIDLLGPLPYTALQSMFDATAPKGLLSYWKTEYLRDLDDNVIDALTENAAKMRSPLSAVHIHHVQGEVSRINADATAFGRRDSPFILNIIGGWTDPAESDNHIAWVREMSQAMQPLATGEAYLNYLGEEGDARIRAAYGAEKYSRLVALKKKYDPTNLFHLNQNIKPA